MGDNVQYILDKLSPTLRLLEVLRLFNSNEVKAIVKKTTEYEYVMKRRQLDLVYVYEYIHYELNLDKLRSIRSKRAIEAIEIDEDYGEDNNNDNENAYDNDDDNGPYSRSTAKGQGRGGVTRKMSTTEKKHGLRNVQTAFLRHICYIFERAIRRFTSDMELWTDYIVFLKNNDSHSLLNTVFGRAIALHPKNEIFWLQASIHELDINRNAHAARVLLQRSLRTNKASELLWLQYFKLELWNSFRVEEREALLGIRSTGGKKGTSSGSSDEAAAAAVSGNKSAVMEGASLVVLKYALKAVPSNSVGYFFQFFELSHRVSRDLSEKVDEVLRGVYANNVSYWENVIRYKICHRDREETEDAAGIVSDCTSMLSEVESCLHESKQNIADKESYNSFLFKSIEGCLDTAYMRLEKANFGSLFTITGVAAKKRKSVDGSSSSVSSSSSPFAVALKALLAFLFVEHRDAVGYVDVALRSAHGALSLVSVLLTRHKAFQLQEAMETGSLPKEYTIDFRGLVEAASRIGISYKKSDDILVGIVREVSRLHSFLLNAAEAMDAREHSVPITKLCLKAAEVVVCCEEGSDVILKALETLSKSSSSSDVDMAKASIELIIKSKYTQANKRGSWCLVYLNTASASGFGASKHVYEATEQIFSKSPALLVSSDIESFHEHYATYVAGHKYSGGISSSEFLFARGVMERMLQTYPKRHIFYDLFERLEMGQLQEEAAQHIRWRKAHIIM